MNLEFEAYPQTDNSYILFIPGDAGDAAGQKTMGTSNEKVSFVFWMPS